MSGGWMPPPPIYTDLEKPTPIPEEDTQAGGSGGLVKVPEGFFSADHPNTKMVLNLLQQGDLPRLKVLMDKSVGSYAVFQVADRGHKDNSRSMFNKQAVLYLSLTGLATYFNKGSIVSVITKEGGASLLRTEFATGVQSGDDLLTFPTEYVAVLMESFDCVVPLLRNKFWRPYDTASLLYRRRYLQTRTPIVGYPDLLRCAMLRSANYNLCGFVASARREREQLSLARLIYLGSIMVQHFHVDLAAGKGIRRVFESPAGPRFVLPNLCSLARRLLTLAAYQDPNGRLLSQVLSAIRECAQAGAFQVSVPGGAAGGKASMLLWLQELVALEHPTAGLFRGLGQATEEFLTLPSNGSEAVQDLREHYQRYDALNCISLLLGLLARYPPTLPDPIGYGRRIMDAACAVALQAGLADPLLLYAWPDHLLALGGLANPLERRVGFDEFARLLQHLPVFASSLAAVSPDMRGADRWRVAARRSVLRLDWNNADKEMPQLMAGQLTVPVTAGSSTSAATVLVSQEQAADAGCCQATEAASPSTALNYAAFYRQFEQRYRMWASTGSLPQHSRPRAMEFREDRPFGEVYTGPGGTGPEGGSGSEQP